VNPPEVNPDFIDMLAALVEQGVDFVIVGAYALAAHGFPRTTGDIDLLVRPTPENAKRVYRALTAFGAPVALHGVGESDFTRPGNIYQIGLPPRRIDILTSISGVSFDEALEGSLLAKIGPVTARIIGKQAMARNKRAAGRPKDLVDADLLERDLKP
jgi:hypothetical protein